MDDVATTKNYAKKVVSVCDVFRKTHKAKIHAIVAKKTKDKVGSTGWLKYYFGAVNQVLDGLSKKRWIRQRMMQSSGLKLFRDSEYCHSFQMKQSIFKMMEVQKCKAIPAL